jgi:hypothetical protein
VRRRLILWFRRTQLLDADAAAAMLSWENSGVSIDASPLSTGDSSTRRIDELPAVDLAWFVASS